MGVTHFMTIISSKGSDTYLFASQCRRASLVRFLTVEPGIRLRCGGLGSFGCSGCCGAGKRPRRLGRLWPVPVTTFLLF